MWCPKNRIFTFKIAFFLVFENDNILRSKSYTVTKSGISPQRKLGSLRHLKLLLIRQEVITEFFFRKDPYKRTPTRAVNARVHVLSRARVYDSCACVRARIFTKKYLLITSYLMRKSLKFRKYPSFR